jgi:hypothetical protein
MRFTEPMHNPMVLRSARLALASLAVLVLVGDHAHSAGGRSERSVESINSRTAGEPILAVVSLRSQRITIYDAKGWTVRAPVSSGQKGRETPAGIFSVIQKDADHHSNLYDDAWMPHMQRLTWSGIALHGGPLPGYPASHGCVRMPFDFAARLFDLTRMGMRVIVAPADIAPVEISHPALFQSTSIADVVAGARSVEADEAEKKANQARLAAVKASQDLARAMMPVRVAENLKLRAEEQLAAAEAALGAAISVESKERAEDAKAKALDRIASLQAQWAAAKAELQPKFDAVTVARQATMAAEAERVLAAKAAQEAARDLEPASVFISRKTQRLYVRRAFEPILEVPISILNPDQPVGTHVFTAMHRSSGDTNLRWTVATLDDGRPRVGVNEPRSRARAAPGSHADPIVTEPVDAKDALDRVVIPPDILERINGMTMPRSSLMISDEPLSPETGKGTDFVVVLSREPQGGIKFRPRAAGI